MSVSRQEKYLTKGRQNQKQRTRDALIDAATELARQGHSLAIADVADAARISTATAYRYFPNPRSLWVEVATRRGPAGPANDIFDDLGDDVPRRIDAVIRQVGELQFGDEALWRGVLHATLERWFAQANLPAAEQVPVRGTSRSDQTTAALAPLADRLPPAAFERLVNAVLLVYGIEAMVSARDVAGMAPGPAIDTMSWAAQALVRAAIAESGA
jgi:AcrR family transcriptional regulator